MKCIPLTSSADSLVIVALLVEVVTHIYQSLVDSALMYQEGMTETWNQLQAVGTCIKPDTNGTSCKQQVLKLSLLRHQLIGSTRIYALITL